MYPARDPAAPMHRVIDDATAREATQTERGKGSQLLGVLVKLDVHDSKDGEEAHAVCYKARHQSLVRINYRSYIVLPC